MVNGTQLFCVKPHSVCLHQKILRNIGSQKWFKLRLEDKEVSVIYYFTPLWNSHFILWKNRNKYREVTKYFYFNKYTKYINIWLLYENCFRKISIKVTVFSTLMLLTWIKPVVVKKYESSNMNLLRNGWLLEFII